MADDTPTPEGEGTLTPIWHADPQGFLLAPDQVFQIVPVATMSLEERYNAVVRCALYFGAVMFLFRGDARYMVVPLLAALTTFLMYEFQVQRTLKAHARARREAMSVPGPGGARCRLPSRDNPFMNLNVTTPPKAPLAGACDLRRAEVRAAVDRNFRHDLYADMDDAFDRNTSARQFYTTPSTTLPNDQAGFAEWLYGGMPGKDTGGARRW